MLPYLYYTLNLFNLPLLYFSRFCILNTFTWLFFTGYTLPYITSINFTNLAFLYATLLDFSVPTYTLLYFTLVHFTLVNLTLLHCVSLHFMLLYSTSPYLSSPNFTFSCIILRHYFYSVPLLLHALPYLTLPYFTLLYSAYFYFGELIHRTQLCLVLP